MGGLVPERDQIDGVFQGPPNIPRRPVRRDHHRQSRGVPAKQIRRRRHLIRRWKRHIDAANGSRPYDDESLPAS